MFKILFQVFTGFFIFSNIALAGVNTNSVKQRIEWSPKSEEVYLDGEAKEVLSFNGARHSFTNKFLPDYQIIFRDRVIAWIGLENVEFEELDHWESALVDRSQLRTFVHPQIDIQRARGESYTIASFVPLRINPITQRVEKVVSFAYSTISAQAHSSTFRMASLNYADHSVLSEGSWLKVGINKDGAYRLTYDQVISRDGSFGGVAVSELMLYGNGGGMLPQKNDDPRIDDLKENRIMVRDNNSNGIFDQGDYIVFYGHGPHVWELKSGQQYQQRQNIYSDTAFYFLTHKDQAQGLRVQDQGAPGGNSEQVFQYFDNRQQHENDLVNLISSGREWYGEIFDFTLNRNFNFDLGELEASSKVCIKVAFAAKSIRTPTEYIVYVNGTELGRRTLPGVSGTYGYRARKGNVEGCVDAEDIANGNLTVRISYNKNGNAGAEGYLNYIRVNSSSKTEVPGRQMGFRRAETQIGGIFQYQVAQTNQNMKIWDVSDPLEPVNQPVNFQDGVTDFKHQNAAGSIPEFVAFDPAFALSPISINKLANQDLHSDQPVELVIFVPDQFRSAAQRLADYRESNDGMSTRLVSLNKIYNEFSSGAQDLSALRNYLKMLYDRDQNGTLKYALLFGDCSYDYKDRVGGNTNFVPVYQSYESIEDITSYSSDDYYGFLEDGKGEWPENGPVTPMDIGVGRLPAKTLQEGENMVDKVIHYSNWNSTLGSWRTWITFVADDGDSNTHQADADGLAKKIAAKNPEYNLNKIYLGSFDQLPSPAGAISPAAREAIDRAILDGTFIMNYSGHGGPVGWTEERILRTDQINGWDNIDKLAFFFTATCEFGRYDDPQEVAGGELSLLNANGGAIGLMTTTRPVYSFSNYNLNNEFYDHAFKKENGDYLRLGEIIRRTKNGYGTNNTRNFALLGDPSMKLNYPQERIRITEVNGKDVSLGADTLNALCLVSVSGEVINEDSTLVSDFNGIADGKFFDKALQLQTLVQNGKTFDYELYKNYIYKGFATVTGGKFTFEFVVPKDIDYSVGKARINIYASRGEDGLDASGSFEEIYVGATCEDVAADNEPPSIELFLDDTTFVNGALVGRDPMLIAFLEDDNGINITGTGIGRGLSAETTALPGEKIPMNDYYQGYPDSYQKGLVNYSFKNFKSGRHTLTFKAWDTHNNSSSSTISFVVAENSEIALSYLYNYPNPFFEKTYFGFDHNRAGDDLDIYIEIYDATGQLVQTREVIVEDSPSVVNGESIEGLSWAPGEGADDPVSDGLYLYRMVVKSLEDGSEYKDVKRMVYVR